MEVEVNVEITPRSQPPPCLALHPIVAKAPGPGTIHGAGQFSFILSPSRNSDTIGWLAGVVDQVRQGREMSVKDLVRLNRYLAAAPVVRRLDAERDSAAVLLAPAVTGIDAVLGEVAASFADTMATGDPTRIKICANSDCGWVIYDQSRNRTRRWCDKTECGNVIKVRRHRQRKRAAKDRSTKRRL